MNRSDLLTNLAMEIAEWPRTTSVPFGSCFDASACITCTSTGDVFTKKDWLTERARLISKPSWDDAPADAEWLAQDSDGTWFWYGDKPESLESPYGIWTGPAVHGQTFVQGVLPAGHDWRETLEKRPQAETIPPKTPEWDGTSWPPPKGARVEVKLNNADDFCEAVVTLIGRTLSSQAPTIAAVKIASGERIFLTSCHMGSNIRSIHTAKLKAAKIERLESGDE